MTRHKIDDDTLDPREAAELEALEAALTGSTADPEWAALVAAVRDEPPVAGDRAQKTLDARVAAGFPRGSRRPDWLRVPSRRKLLPALAATSALVIGGVVVGTGGLGGDGSDSATSYSSSSGAASATQTEAAPPAPAPSDSGSAAESSATTENSTEAVPPGATPLARELRPSVEGLSPDGSSKKADAVPPGKRSVERTATLELTTGAKELQDASDRIIRATQDLGGVVGSSQTSGGPSGGNADFELRVPSARLDDALKRFGEIANVNRLSQGAEDITGAVVSSKDRLSDARRERKALLGALGKADKEQEISSLRSQIRINRGQIARLEGDVRSLERRSDLATVKVSLLARGKGAAAGTKDDDGSAWGPGAAADTALRVLSVAAGVLVVAAAILAPLLLLSVLLGFGARGLRRRRREAALGAT